MTNPKNGAKEQAPVQTQGQGIEVSMGQGTVEVAGATVGTFLTQLYATVRHEQEVGARVAEGVLGLFGTLGARVVDLVQTKIQADGRVELTRAQVERDHLKLERERARTQGQANRTEQVRVELERERLQMERERLQMEREQLARAQREDRERGEQVEAASHNGRASMWAPDEL